MKRQSDKKSISYGQADNLLVAIAQKYDAFNNTNNEDAMQVEIDSNTILEIVNTETFIVLCNQTIHIKNGLSN